MGNALLELRNVTKEFGSKRGKTVAVNDISFSLMGNPPITLAIVGESGSGKSTLANLILRFFKPTQGTVLFGDANVAEMRGQTYSRYRHDVQAVFQNPFDTFNPFYTVDHVFGQVFRNFDFHLSQKEQKKLIVQKLEQMKLDPSNVLGKYSYQLSGGQLQRLMIARALMLTPKLLVADEPVSMIDASLRVTVLDVLVKLKEEHNISQVYITHDLSTALQISDQILVMYKGHVVESGDAEEVIINPAHPYTQMLIRCIPIPDPSEKWSDVLEVQERCDDSDKLEACCFFAHCPYATEACLSSKPQMRSLNSKHKIACHVCEK